MKTIGLIGGMSWESTITYYKIINETIKNTLGGFHSAKILLYSVDFQEIEECQTREDWEKGADILVQAAQSLERGGADFILICTNTMHKVVPQMEKEIGIPIVHIAKATADKLKESKIGRVALLGTKYTMEQDFYKDKLLKEGISVLVPGQQDREIVNHVIYHELCMGIVSPESKAEYIRIMKGLADAGAQGIVLGCTEIGLLIKPEDVDIPVFDTAWIHAVKAAALSIESQEVPE